MNRWLLLLGMVFAPAAMGAEPDIPIDWAFSYVPTQADPLTERNLIPYVSVTNINYFIRSSGDSGNYTLKLDLRTLPDHDAFEHALQLPIIAGQPQGVWQYNNYATSQLQEPALLHQGKTLWYRIQVPYKGKVTAQVEANTLTSYPNAPVKPPGQIKPLGKPFISAWSGTNIANLQFCADNRVPNTNSIVPYTYNSSLTFAVTTNTIYMLRVDSADSEGEFRFTCSFRSDAINDHVANALVLPLTGKEYDNGVRYLGSATGDNFGATTESGEPLDLQKTVWYKLTIPLTGYLDLYGTLSGTNDPATTPVAVFAAPSNATVIGQLTRRAGKVTSAPTETGTDFQINSLSVTQGGTIYLCISATEDINYSLNAFITKTPINDRFTNALVLSQTQQALVYNHYATAGEIYDYILNNVSYTLWWRFTPSADGTFSVRSEAFPADYWRLLKGSSRTRIYPTSSSSGIRTFPIVSNEVYNLWFANTNTSEGQVSFELWGKPVNDLFTNATGITTYTEKNYDNGTVRVYRIQDRNNGTHQTGENPTNAVWYRWTSPAHGFVDVDISSTIPSFQISKGNNIGALTPITTPYETTNGETLNLAVGGNYDIFTITCDFRDRPNNDQPASATPLLLGKTYENYTRYASTTNTGKAADVWFVYDTAQANVPIEFRVNPAINGQLITLDFYQDNQHIGTHTFTNRNEDPYVPSLNQGSILIQVSVEQSDTDFSLIATPYAENDDFNRRQTLTLEPQQWDVTTDQGNVTMRNYSRRVIISNRNATRETDEVDIVQETTKRSGRTLWWDIIPPNIYGTISIVALPGSPPLSMTLSTGGTLPTSPNDYLAWNIIKQSQTMTWDLTPGKTYQLRVDTQSGYENQLIAFEVMAIEYPDNDFVQDAQLIPLEGQMHQAYYKDQFLLSAISHVGSTMGCLYGATRQAFDGKIEITGNNAALLASVPAPYGQTLWYKITIPETKLYKISTAGSSFPVFMALLEGTPPRYGGNYITNQQSLLLTKGKTYYLLIDAAVHATNTFGDYIEIVPNRFNGIAYSGNRTCQESIPGGLNLRIESQLMAVNDQTPEIIQLKPFYAIGTNTQCGNYVSRYYGYGATINDNATREDTLADTFNLGAGKTVWWTINPAVSGPLNLDFSASSCPASLRIYDNNLSNWVEYTNSPIQITAIAGVPCKVAMDSRSGTNGILVLEAWQTANAPLNDNFADAREIATGILCGNLKGSTLEMAETSTGTGSIWYRWHNYASTNVEVTFEMFGDETKRMTIYRGTALASLLPVTGTPTAATQNAPKGETLYLRVYDTAYPPNGDIQLVMSITDTNYFLAQFYITPSTVFTNKLLVQAQKLSEAPVQFQYAINEPVNVASPKFYDRFITDSANYNFLVSFLLGPTFTVSREYIRGNGATLTPSQVFNGSLWVNVTNAGNATLTYAIGDANGNAPTNPIALPFTGLLLTNSAHLIVRVQQDNESYLLQGHYTNTVAPIQWSLANQQVTLWTPTPEITYSIQQDTNTLVINTNPAVFTADYPFLTATAQRTGWKASKTNINLASSYVENLLPLGVYTNSMSTNYISLTFTNPNPESYIWYLLTKPDGTQQMGRDTNTLILNAPYSFEINAFAATAIMNRRSPSTNITFTAKLMTPEINRANNQVTINDLNATEADSTLIVNNVPLGLRTWSTPLNDEIHLTTWATSPNAQPSDPVTLNVAYTPYLVVAPATGTINSSTLKVIISSSTGSRLRLTITQEGTTQHRYIPENTASLTLDKPTTLIVQAERNGIIHSSSTNTYEAKLAPPTINMPPIQNGQFSVLSPILLTSPTPGATFLYKDRFLGSWQPTTGEVSLRLGTNDYAFQTVKPGWIPSDEVRYADVVGFLPNTTLTNFVSPYWTLLPGVTTKVIATNPNLRNTPDVKFIHQVYAGDTIPQDSQQWASYIPLTTPVTNYPVLHRVVQQNLVAGTTNFGSILLTRITATYFDFIVEDSDPYLQVGEYTEDMVLFYKPVWIRAANSNTVLQAVGKRLAYDFESVRDGDRFLIPGNLLNTNRIQLRYKNPGQKDWKYFAMRFQTLAPNQMIGNDGTTIYVQLDPRYLEHPVGAYYTTNTPPNLTEPFSQPITIQDLLGQFKFYGQTTNEMYWLNSKYNLTNWPNIQLFNNLPVVPLTP